MFSVALILLLAAGSCVYSIDLIQPESKVVQPGQSLTITYQVSGYFLTSSSYGTGWIRQREGKPMDWIFHQWGGSGSSFWQNDALKNKFSYNRDMSAGTVTITGQNLQPEDTAVYYCVRYTSGWGYGYFDYWGKGTQVTVTSVTSNGPTVFPLTACGSGTGDMITLGCLATDFTPSSLTFAWTKAGTALTEFIQYPSVQKGDLYTGVSQIQVRRQDWDARQTWQCAVTHVAGNAGPVDFTKPKVICQLPTLKVLASSEEENEVSFSCFAKDFSPKDYEIKWLKDGVEITDKIYEIKTPIDEKQFDNGTKLYSASSFLTMKSSKVPPKTKLTCRFKGKNEICDGFINSTLTYGCEWK
ncbi:Ig heavy chain Mem5 [Lates calcarifer]|uniref:Ig heavy chain Mem5 n=1 Tax=Lates calcarifer TaxID=8187 RepID=A0AAJ8DT66_LATCA|nr:Ig heavy chain Mem5 [Lates calcarifer]